MSGGGMYDFGLSGAGLGLGGGRPPDPRDDFGVGGWL
jgi:hypothetical protein